MSSVIPRESLKSVHPSTSAEGDGWTDFELWMIWMTQEWWTEYGMMSSVIPRESLKSVPPSSSAEGDGWTDFELRMIWMTHEMNDWWMMDWWLNDWNGGGMTRISDGGYFDHLHPWPSLSFLVILKWLYRHSMAILTLNDLRMIETMLEWRFSHPGMI